MEGGSTMDCNKCGTKMIEGENFCQSCGTTALARNSIQTFHEPLDFSKTDYAGFWLRVAAWLLDTIFLLILVSIISFISGLILGLILVIISSLMELQDVLLDVVIDIIVIVVPWLYYTLMEWSSMQGTLGKKIVGIKVTDLNGNRISFGRATGRHFGKFLSSIFSIGFIAVIFTEKKQGYHDLLTRCLVVKR